MNSFIPTDAQARAITDIKDWFLNRTDNQQVYRVFGYAGTGKSTLVAHVINELGLNMQAGSMSVVPDVLQATFTGKATYVLRKKGVPCRTIHSLIYAVTEATDEEIAEAKKKLATMMVDARELIGLERVVADAGIETLSRDIRDMRKPRWRLNDESDVRDCKLLVLDEVSMVGEEMATDLLSFEKPILVLGDPGQLPPIRGTGAFTEGVEPDVMLTEIHRQAEESAIIRLATMAREGGFIPYGKHDEFVWKMSRHDVLPKQMLRADQVICGRNATRLMLNNAMRKAAGQFGRLPTGPNDKIICLKNDHGLGLINGMFLTLDNIGELNRDIVFSASVDTEEGESIGGLYKSGKPKTLPIYAGHFLDHEVLDREREERDWKEKKGKIEATYGYAITGHKSQGSAWSKIMVWDDHLGRTPEDRARWLYTAITRAESGLVILD